jgi:hypothetical protein
MSILVWWHMGEKSVPSWSSRSILDVWCVQIFSGWNWSLVVRTVIGRILGIFGSMRVSCLTLCPVNGFLRVPGGLNSWILRDFWTKMSLQKPSTECWTTTRLLLFSAWNDYTIYNTFRWVFYQLNIWYLQWPICTLSCHNGILHSRAISQLNVFFLHMSTANK